MTATEVSRHFAAALDAVERGETITITRGSHRVATLGPAPQASGRAVKDMLASWQGRLDDEWEADIRAAREVSTDEIRSSAWDDE